MLSCTLFGRRGESDLRGFINCVLDRVFVPRVHWDVVNNRVFGFYSFNEASAEPPMKFGG